MRNPIAVTSAGMMTCVGYNVLAACAAIRAQISGFQETSFIDRAGEWINGAPLPFTAAMPAFDKLSVFLTQTIAECLGDKPTEQLATIPLLLCLPEKERPGCLADLETHLHGHLRQQHNIKFHPDSLTIPRGRASAAIALMKARDLLYEHGHTRVLIAGVDSYLHRPTIRAFEQKNRLLTSVNSNGFVPGEGAAAVLVEKPMETVGPQLRIIGLGLSQETATIESDKPLRADGLTAAISEALDEAGLGLHELDYRIADLSGEQFYFKEAALAATRLLKQRKEDFDLWHTADCIGETGAAVGVINLCVALMAGRKAYSPGPGALLHFSTDDGYRTSIVTRYG